MDIEHRASASGSRAGFASAAAGIALTLVSAWVLRHWTSKRVQRWQPGGGTVQRSGALGVRVFGRGEPVLVLLPGIGASQAFYGAVYDRLGDVATVLVMDPLGFGSSIDPGTDPEGFALSQHTEALSGALRELGFSQRPLIVVGHSMGASLALQWVAGVDSDVRAVIAFNAPLYYSREEATDRVGQMGWFEALLSSGPLARGVCWWMCRHRTTASAIAVLMNPAIPIAIARDGVKHTWFSYIGSFRALVSGDTWVPALSSLLMRQVSVDLVDGASDPVPMPGRADMLADRYGNVTARTHPGGHDLPLTSPGWCAEYIYRRVLETDLSARKLPI